MSIKEAVARVINRAFVTRVRRSLTMELDTYMEKGYAKSPVDVCRKGVSSVARLFSMSAEKREKLTQNIIGQAENHVGRGNQGALTGVGPKNG